MRLVTTTVLALSACCSPALQCRVIAQRNTTSLTVLHDKQPGHGWVASSPWLRQTALLVQRLGLWLYELLCITLHGSHHWCELAVDVTMCAGTATSCRWEAIQDSDASDANCTHPAL